MADRVKRRYRGQTYYAKSSRPGKKTVRVKAHCRKPPLSRLVAKFLADRDIPF
jgi:hypothetical protein